LFFVKTKRSLWSDGWPCAAGRPWMAASRKDAATAASPHAHEKALRRQVGSTHTQPRHQPHGPERATREAATI
jgi:hypothetical protein